MSKYNMFQSTPPVGGDTRPGPKKLHSAVFQSTPPVGGDTCRNSPIACVLRFNPRPP